MELRLGEERPVRLPLPGGTGTWRHEISGMASAVRVRKLWRAHPYPEDDEPEPGPAEEIVFMVRGANPGAAVLHFLPDGAEGSPRRIAVTVRR